jgi:hypothetical protein
MLRPLSNYLNCAIATVAISQAPAEKETKFERKKKKEIVNSGKIPQHEVAMI